MATDVVLTSGGLAWVRDCLAAESRDMMPAPPRYIAISSGTDLVSRHMATLPGETYRAAIISRGAVDGTVTFRTFLTKDDNNGQTVGRYGIIAGDAEGQPGGAGVLIAVANERDPFPKDATKTLTNMLSLTISGSLTAV